MNYREAMNQLEAMGTAQNRKIYGRHGVTGAMFGVSYANLYKLQKSIKTDADLSLRLWASGNHDARVLASLVANDSRMSQRVMDAWARDLDNYVVTDAFSALVARTPLAVRKMERWTRSRKEWVCRAGWSILAKIALDDGARSDRFFKSYVRTIESDIHRSKNRVRDAMLQALIAIGLRNPRLETAARAAARRIGKVDVDHGETSCKTPEPLRALDKARAYRARKKSART